MRTPTIKTIACAVVVVAFCCLSSAQVTQYQEDQNLGMEAHVGKLNGHAKAAKMNYRRYCAGCHGVLGDGEGENAVWLDPAAQFYSATSSAAPRPAGLCPPTKTCSTPLGEIAGSNMPS
jgi:hypothetical protein